MRHFPFFFFSAAVHLARSPAPLILTIFLQFSGDLFNTGYRHNIRGNSAARILLWQYWRYPLSRPAIGFIQIKTHVHFPAYRDQFIGGFGPEMKVKPGTSDRLEAATGPPP